MIRYKTCFSSEQQKKFNQTQGTGELALSVPYLFHHCSTGLKFLVDLNNKKDYDPNYFQSLFLRDMKKREKPRNHVSRVNYLPLAKEEVGCN